MALKGHKRVWEYRLLDIADVTGRSIHTVRDDRMEGKFDPDSLLSVSQYVMGYVLIRGAEKWTIAKKED